MTSWGKHGAVMWSGHSQRHLTSFRPNIGLSSRSLPPPDPGMLRPSGCPDQQSGSARSSKHREQLSRSPRKRREGKRSQRRGDDHEQRLWEMERRRLPGQHEHLEPAGSSCDAVESSPKRSALQVAQFLLLQAGSDINSSFFYFLPHRRAHFLHGPYPATHFGPKACILPNPTSVM
ncbi:hypothetical protein GOODEAATRI_002397 [Goodea atripinnis]|uniref:Uncharacterized protein n=1 Tax=Goodea atripinnis TaxID=208336 RepID=A0ABV0PVE7_9TELE